MLKHWPWEEVLRRAASEYHMTPKSVWECTPAELMALFGKPTQSSASTPTPDREELLILHNKLMATRGVRPRAPSWFLPHLRKGWKNV